MDIPNTNIIELIKENYSTLSTGQKAIGDYIIANPEQACFLSLKEFSARTQTTPVSVLRFARKLGLESFINLKKELQVYISTQLTPNDKLHTAMGQLKNHGSQLQDAIYEVAHMDLINVQRTIEALRWDDVWAAADILKNSKNVYLAGHNISHSTNVCFFSRLNALSINTQHFEIHNPALMTTKLTFINKDDAFILVTFPSYTEEVVFLAEYLHRTGVPVILLSDTRASSLAANADIVFPCAIETPIFFNSYASPMVVANILTSALALQMEDRFSKMQKTRAELREELDAFLAGQNMTYKKIP